MPTLPRKATLDLNTNKLFIDGEEFPWWITEDGVEVSGLLEKSGVITLTFSMFVDTAEVIPAASDESSYTVSTETTSE